MDKKKVLILATNYGSWGEELQAPWDIIKKAGHEVVLATPLGKKPLPLKVSVDPEFLDPVQGYKTNPPDVCARIKELVDGTEWAHPLRFADASMANFDALVLTGGLGAMIDMCNNWQVHRLIMEAYRANKLIGGLCYAISTLVFVRDPENQNRSILYGKRVTAHPAAWDFYGPDYDFTYEMYGATPDNPGTDVHTPGFLWPAQRLTEDAVGPDGRVIYRHNTSRDNPCAVLDWPFVTGTSVESSRAYGDKIVEALALKNPPGSAKDKKIGILMENNFYEPEIWYYKQRFKEEGMDVHFLTRLWGNASLTFKGNEYQAPFVCDESFENMDDAELASYDAIIVPAGEVTDHLRYTDDLKKLPPAVAFMKRAFAMKHIVKGVICHGLQLFEWAPELVRGRHLTTHNNLVPDATLMGAFYEDKDLVVDDDLVSARAGGNHPLLAQAIIDKLSSKVPVPA